MLTLSTLTREYVRVSVSATANGSPINPTTDVVAMAFVAPTVNPQSGDWQTASWDTNPTNGVYTAQCLVGPGGTIALAAGTYTVWVRVTDNPEIPVRVAGGLLVQ